MPRKLQVFSLEGRKSLKVDIVVLEFLISAGWGEGLFFLFMFSVCSSCLKTFTPSSMGSQIVSQKDSLRCKEEIKLKKNILIGKNDRFFLAFIRTALCFCNAQ